MKKKALLLVDLQKDFCPGGALAVENGDAVVAPLIKVAAFAKSRGWPLFASRDWHPRNTRHFAEFGGTWPVHCVQHSEGAKFHPQMEACLAAGQAVIISTGAEPTEDGYSAFDGRSPSGKLLDDTLKAHGIEALYLGGLATDYCVKASAIDAARKGYQTFLLLDACRAVNLNPGDGEKAVEEMKHAGVIITSSEEVLKSAGK